MLEAPPGFEPGYEGFAVAESSCRDAPRRVRTPVGSAARAFRWVGKAWGRIALAALLASAGCSCEAEVVEEITIGADGGQISAPAHYCATECATSGDCGAGMHCSLHPEGQAGLCFRNFPDAGP
jgi:hypothetical protein